MPNQGEYNPYGPNSFVLDSEKKLELFKKAGEEVKENPEQLARAQQALIKEDLRKPPSKENPPNSEEVTFPKGIKKGLKDDWENFKKSR